jgi:hypothetical protein
MFKMWGDIIKYYILSLKINLFKKSMLFLNGLIHKLWYLKDCFFSKHIGEMY